LYKTKGNNNNIINKIVFIVLLSIISFSINVVDKLIILAIIVLSLSGYSFYTHNIADNNIKEINEFKEIIYKKNIL
jgi:hypothetical protein